MADFIDVFDPDAFARKCHRAAREVREDLRRHVRDAAKVGERAAKLSAASVRIQAAPPSRHHRPTPHPNLNAALVAGISLNRTAYGAEIIQKSPGLTGRNDNRLPAAINRGTWRHPVYGHRNASVLQTAAPVHYFTGAIEGVTSPMRSVVADVLDDIVRRLE